MREFVPLWKTPSRQQAIDVLVACRTSTAALIQPLSAHQLREPTVLGDGTWSVKDLLGHLAEWEIRALETLGARRKATAPAFATVDEQNDFHIERKRSWSLPKVQREYDAVRDDLVAAIGSLDDERWLAKIETRGGRSAMALVLGKMLNGGRWGFFAHDLAHRADLTRAVQRLSLPTSNASRATR